MIFSSSIHLPVTFMTSFSFTCNTFLLSIEGYLGCVYYQVIVNRMAINMAEQVRTEYDAEFFGHVLGSGKASSHDVFTFSSQRVLSNDFQSDMTSL